MKELSPTLKKTAELALIRAIPDMILENCGKGRLHGLNLKIIEQVDNILSQMPRTGYMDMELISRKIFEFATVTGWERKQKHVATFASFALEMIENSPFTYPDKITDLLNDLIDYFERAGRITTAPFFAGGVAYEKWNQIIYGGSRTHEKRNAIHR